MNESKMHPLEAAFIMFTNGLPEIVGKTKLEDTLAIKAVSTVLTVDLGYETAVSANLDEWHPVERYATRELAEQGHERWVAAAPGLSEVMELDYPGYVEEKLIKF